jgi:hypothetical protein
MFIFIGCESNGFIINTTINPKLTQVGDKMAVEYELGDLLILDEWSNLNAAELLFLKNNKAAKKINLKVKCSDSFAWTNYFYYTIGNIDIKTNPTTWNTLYRNVNSFPGVTWITRDDKTAPSVDSSIKVEKKTEVNNNNQMKRLE